MVALRFDRCRVPRSSSGFISVLDFVVRGVSVPCFVTSNRHKNAYFVLEGLNSLATTYYGYYLFFYFKDTFGFGNLGNLTLAAAYGLIYTATAWLCGRFAQKFGYFRALRTGFSIMTISLVCGLALTDAWEQIVVMIGWTIGMCFTWPTLEALVSEGAAPRRLQKLIGIYNLVWSGAAAVAYFFGGTLIETLGAKSLFYLPAIIHLCQILLLRRVENWPRGGVGSRGSIADGRPAEEEMMRRASSVSPSVFLKLAWIGNPFAYVAINTILAVIPMLAQQLGLSRTWAGIFCSVWLFARLGSFAFLWLWTDWHYRFRWFFGAYLMIITTFLVILLVPNLVVIIGAQVIFGAAVGLIYYSSLYYSMDVGDTKGEHGGFHESALGAGQFLGPAIGAIALALRPKVENSETWAVAALLTAGLVIILMVRGVAGRGEPRGGIMNYEL